MHIGGIENIMQVEMKELTPTTFWKSLPINENNKIYNNEVISKATRSTALSADVVLLIFTLLLFVVSWKFYLIYKIVQYLLIVDLSMV